ncbi:hypothetical protein [Flavobacterium phage FL-1]|nr:hypothetical protein [Flavobacterium phage FL-1]
MLDLKETYHRKKDILYDSKNNPIIKFEQHTADCENLTGNLVHNMNNYIRCYPDRVEILEKKENGQLNLF